jgi:hypothetical protein
MRLTAEVECTDLYDRQLIEKLLCLTKLQDDNQSRYSLKSNVLESIISLKNKKGLVKLTDDNNHVTETIDLIITPYKHNGKKVCIDDCGEFKDSESGLFVMEIKPRYDELKSNGLSNYATSRKPNHEYAIFKFPSNIIYSGVPLDVMIYLSLKPKPAEMKNSEIKSNAA